MTLNLLSDTPLNLKGTLQAMWTNNSPLMQLHPDVRFFTGRVPLAKNIPQPMPYTRLAMPGGSRGVRTSSTEYPLQMVKFHVWTDTAEEGDAISEAIQDCYRDKAFAYSDGKVIDTRYDSDTQTQIVKPNYTAWETVVGFTMRLMRNRVT